MHLNTSEKWVKALKESCGHFRSLGKETALKWDRGTRGDTIQASLSARSRDWYERQVFEILGRNGARGTADAMS